MDDGNGGVAAREQAAAGAQGAVTYNFLRTLTAE